MNMVNIFISLFCVLFGLIDDSSGSVPNMFIKETPILETFVDKTYLLKEVVSFPTMGGYMVTCPPKFGKTTNLHMMEAFFAIDWTSDGQILKDDMNARPYYKYFSKLSVSKDLNMMQNHFAQYFVLFLDMSYVNLTSATKYWETLNNAIKNCIKKYRYFIEKLRDNEDPDEALNREDKRKIQNYFKVLNDTSDNKTVKFAVKNTAYLLSTFYHRRVMVLVDQADTLFASMVTNSTDEKELTTTEEELISFYSTFVKQPPKSVYYSFFTCTNEFLSQKFSKHLKVIQQRKFLVKHGFSKFCGFTFDEIDKLLDENGLVDRERQNVMRFFFGYAVGHTDILLYNPVSTTNGFRNPRLLCERYAPPVWVKEVNLKKLASCLRYPDIREQMTKLLGNGTVQFSTTPYFDGDIATFASFVKTVEFENCGRLGEFSQDMIYKYLFEKGYLTCVQYRPELLCLPSEEIKREVRSWLNSVQST